MPSIKSRLFSTWIYLGAVLVAPLLAPLPADAENDLYARQLASVTAGARSADQQLVAAHAEEEYLRKRQELLRRLEPTNTLSGALGGVAVRTGLTLLIPGGYLPITGGVLAAYAIKSFLDRETARLLLETGRADPELFGQIVESNPGVARAGLAATALRRSSLFSAADNGKRGAACARIRRGSASGWIGFCRGSILDRHSRRGPGRSRCCTGVGRPGQLCRGRGDRRRVS